MNEERLKQFAESQAKIAEALIKVLDEAIQNQQAMLSLLETSKEIKSELLAFKDYAKNRKGERDNIIVK